MENIKRIQLLSSTEVEELYARPDFNAYEQSLYFALNRAERAALEEFRNTQTRIHFILQLGYFKAKQQFFNFSLDEVGRDVQYVVETYYGGADISQFKGCFLANMRVTSAKRYSHFSTTEAGHLSTPLK